MIYLKLKVCKTTAPLLLRMLHACIGITHVNVFLMAINIPTMSMASLMKRQKEVRPAVEKVAKQKVWTPLLEKGHANWIFSMVKTDSSLRIFCPTMWYIWLNCKLVRKGHLIFCTVIEYIKIHTCDFEGLSCTRISYMPKTDTSLSVFYSRIRNIRLDCKKN